MHTWVQAWVHASELVRNCENLEHASKVIKHTSEVMKHVSGVHENKAIHWQFSAC